MATDESLRKRLKSVVDGNLLMNWYPQLKTNGVLLGKVLKELQDYIVENDAWEISPENLKVAADVFIKRLDTQTAP